MISKLCMEENHTRVELDMRLQRSYSKVTVSPMPKMQPYVVDATPSHLMCADPSRAQPSCTPTKWHPLYLEPDSVFRHLLSSTRHQKLSLWSACHEYCIFLLQLCVASIVYIIFTSVEHERLNSNYFRAQSTWNWFCRSGVSGEREYPSGKHKAIPKHWTAHKRKRKVENRCNWEC